MADFVEEQVNFINNKPAKTTKLQRTNWLCECGAGFNTLTVGTPPEQICPHCSNSMINANKPSDRLDSLLINCTEVDNAGE